MSKPEIVRRCQTCGASIREAAAFCPECGEGVGPLDRKGKPNRSAATTPLVQSTPAQSETDSIRRPESVREKLETDEAATSREAIGSRPRFREGTGGKPGKTPVDKVREAPVGKVRDKIQRAGNLARDVEGDMKHRVQKVRQMSSVVLDEAGYDPSLRFVLVAAALFLLFILIMVLNKVIG
jgi:hypothetical protein